MIIAVLRETATNERRVALVPETVQRFVKSGSSVSIERGAGVAASFPDDEYVKAGATIARDAATLVAEADVVVVQDRTDPGRFRCYLE